MDAIPMDSILSEFIHQTKADPALAQDLLEATEWNLDAAVTAFTNFQNTKAVEVPEYQYNPRDFESIACIPEEPVEGETEAPDGRPPEMKDLDENEAKRREVVRKKKTKRSRGLAFPEADEVMSKFSQVAVTKQRVSTKEQVIIDEKFFSHSFVYPDLSSEENDLQEYIFNDLLEVSHKRVLEKSGRLNWWTSTGKLPKLEPLATSGDGNCLLHAASLYMWGLHDHSLILRTALHRLLTLGLEREGVKRRWKFQTQLRNNEAGGLIFTEEEWEFEWGEILRIATNQPRPHPTTDSIRRYSSLRVSYESLEEIHISVLAHTLRRPIIVISDRTIKDMSGQDLAPIYFGGIYLPLEVNPTACHKSPIVLAYDSSHFSPLISTQDSESSKQPRPKHTSRKEAVIPLVTPDGSLLPVQFVYDPKRKDVKEKWSRMEYEVGEFPDDIVRLLESYLNVRWIQLKVTSSDAGLNEDHIFPIQVPKVRFPAASITQEEQPIYQKELIERYLKHIRLKYQEEMETKAHRLAEREEDERKKLESVTVPCEGEGCDMYGRAATNNMCSLCYQKSLLARDAPWPYGDEAVDTAPRGSNDLQGYSDSDHEYGANHQEEEALDGVNQGLLPGHSEPETNSSPSQRVLTDQTNAGRSLLQQEHRPSGDVPAPPSPRPRHTVQSDHTLQDTANTASKISSHSPGGDENTPKSRSPTPPALPSRLPPSLPAAAKVAPPLPLRGGERAPPIPSKGTPQGVGPAPTGPATTNQAPKSKLVVPEKPKKSPSKPGPGSRYTRDNILPLHLESGQTSLGVTGGEGAKKNCITINCEFYGSPNCAGYCSSCYKALGESATLV